MNSLKNNVRLIGRLGQDPEERNFESGKKLVTFSLATNEVYYNAEGEKIEDTQWHNIVAWSKTAENAVKFLKKGSQAAVSGKLIHRSYEKDGETRYTTEIQVAEFLALDGNSGESSEA